MPIDIRPGDSPNPINLDSPGKLPVAILSTATFDASKVDPATIKFGRTGTEAAPVSYSISDVNGDKRKDFVCQFNIADSGFQCGDTAGVLRASTTTGCPLIGTDTVQVLGCPAYSLSVLPVQDVNHLTDVYLWVTPVLPGYTAPASAKNLVLKSFDIFGKQRWTKTAQGVVLTPASGGSTVADLKYTDVEHGQSIKAQLQVTDGAPGSSKILRQEGRVLFRPDLTVQSVNAVSQANLYQIVNISASVKELKGDLGATTTVYLKDGDTVIDVATGVSVPALGNVGVTFSTIFQAQGVHHLKIVVGDVAPGDYDLSNNETSFAIEAVQPPLAPVFYCSSYNHYDYDSQVVIENPFWISTYHDQYTNETTSQTLYIPAAFQSAIGRVTLTIAVDGAEAASYEGINTELFPYYDDGCYKYQSGSQTLADNVYFYVQTSMDCFGNQNSYASFSKYAFSEIYFSSTYDKLWNSTSTYSNSTQYGAFLNAVNSIETRFIIDGDVGSFGGTGNFGVLSVFPFDDSFDYYEYDYNDGLYDEHVTGTNQGKSVYGGICDVTVP